MCTGVIVMIATITSWVTTIAAPPSSTVGACGSRSARAATAGAAASPARSRASSSGSGRSSSQTVAPPTA